MITKEDLTELEVELLLKNSAFGEPVYFSNEEIRFQIELLKLYEEASEKN